jgi:hypothetical protein
MERTRVGLEIRDTASPILPIALDPVSKPSVTFNPDPYPHPHTNSDVVIVSDTIKILEGMDNLFIVNRSKKARCASVAAVSVFLATAAIDIVTIEALHEPVPTPFMILAAISGATVVLMGVGFYLKDKIDGLKTRRNNNKDITR